jgi:hypothetical protein
MRAPGRPGFASQGEDGAVLLLALVFILVIAIVLTSLLTFTGNDLTNTSNLRSQRSLEYAADGATDAALQAVRYSESAYRGGPQPCMPDDAPFMSINGDEITVDCGNGTRSARTSCISTSVLPCETRSVNLYACEGTGTCTSTSSRLQLQAVVAFDDYSSSNVLMCQRGGSASTATCGTGMAVVSWVVRGANS